MSKLSFNQRTEQNNLKNEEQNNLKMSTSTKPTFNITWVSDYGIDGYNLAQAQNMINNEDTHLAYITSEAVNKNNKIPNKIFTGDLDPNARFGAGRNMQNGLELAMLAYDSIETHLKESTTDYELSLLATGGASSPAFECIRATIQKEIEDTLKNTMTETQSASTSKFAKREVKTFVAKTGFISTILEPSRATDNVNEIQNHDEFMNDLMDFEGGCPISYQIIKVDDAQKHTQGTNSREENLRVGLNQLFLLRKIIVDMTELLSTQGTNIDKSEVARVVCAKGEIIANIGSGSTMKEALKNFKNNILVNNSQASLLGATDILIKFLYPNTEYTQAMTADEADIIRELSKMGSGDVGIAPMVKDSVVLGCNVNQPTMMIMAGGIMSEDQRKVFKRSAVAGESKQKTDLINTNFEVRQPTKTKVGDVESAFLNANVEMTRSTQAYTAYLNKSKTLESIMNSDLSENEKRVILSIKNL